MLMEVDSSRERSGQAVSPLENVGGDSMDSGAVVFRAERNTNTELDAERYVGENAARLFC